MEEKLEETNDSHVVANEPQNKRKVKLPSVLHRMITAAIALIRRVYNDPVWIVTTALFVSACTGFVYSYRHVQELANEYNATIDRARIIGTDLHLIDELRTEVNREKEDSNSILFLETELVNGLVTNSEISRKLLDLNEESASRQAERLYVLRSRLETCNFESDYAKQFSERCSFLHGEVVRMQKLYEVIKKLRNAMKLNEETLTTAIAEMSNYTSEVLTSMDVAGHFWDQDSKKSASIIDREATNRNSFDNLAFNMAAAQIFTLICFAYMVAFVSITIYIIYSGRTPEK